MLKCGSENNVGLEHWVGQELTQPTSLPLGSRQLNGLGLLGILAGIHPSCYQFLLTLSQILDRLLSMKKAFTLIELLVVIAILAILSALIIPVISGARNKKALHKIQQQEINTNTPSYKYYNQP